MSEITITKVNNLEVNQDMRHSYEKLQSQLTTTKAQLEKAKDLLNDAYCMLQEHGVTHHEARAFLNSLETPNISRDGIGQYSVDTPNGPVRCEVKK